MTPCLSFRIQNVANAFRSIRNATVIASAVLVLGVSSALAQDNKLGIVDFKTSCVEEAQSSFEHGLALLHHMMYFQAGALFDKAALKTPDCAMLHWGVAMSNFHPLWPGRPSKKAMSNGGAAVKQMNAIDNVSGLERALIAAASAFYTVDTTNYRERISAWATAQKAAFDQFPNDVDATAFYALSQLVTAPRGDKTMAQQRAAGDLLEGIHAKFPLHPGAIHYAIHAYDNPALAGKGLRFARIYGKIAPDVPHALHMPSHIFVRLGHWEETIEWNERSASAALAQPLGDTISSHYAHAMDYLIYSQLQRGVFQTAEKLVEEFLSHKNQQSNFGSAYALAASPVRVLLEQEKWSEVANLSINMHPAIAWEKFPQARAMVWFAKGIGAARIGKVEIANQALTELGDIRSKLEKSKQGYWAKLTNAQIKSIQAWLELKKGDIELATKLQLEAADIEDAVGKSPVTPGHVLPARELLGDMYVQLDQIDYAKLAYEKALSTTPNRRRSLKGLVKLRGAH